MSNLVIVFVLSAIGLAVVCALVGAAAMLSSQISQNEERIIKGDYYG